MFFKRMQLSIYCLLIGLSGVGQSTTEQLSAVMHTFHHYNMFDGAVLVADHGTVVYKEAFGLANREWDIPNSTDTKFMIGSISKPITATLILILTEKNLINLDSSLAYYVPQFKDKPASKVTIKQLLNHTSGLRCV